MASAPTGPTWPGVVLVIAYCVGLGIPFVLLALGSGGLWAHSGWLRLHSRAIQVFGGVLLIGVGVALVTGGWNEFVSWLRDAFVSDVKTADLMTAPRE